MTRITRRRVRGGLTALAACAAVAGAPAVLAAPTPVTITMGAGADFQTSVAPASAKAGPVAFTLRNRGTTGHSAVILRTNVRYDRLPVSKSTASEKGRVGAIARVAAGRSRALTLTLPAGKYVIICNIAGHYESGMRAAFTVRR